MRLYNVRTGDFREFFSSIPSYVIASHRWEDEELTYQDVLAKRTKTAGYLKLRGFSMYVNVNFPRIEWLWIDTCCIDKTNSVELSEAINSMFKWYRNSIVCLAYLRDVDSTSKPDTAQLKSGPSMRDTMLRQLKNSEWFTRGWTLQELVAPRKVIFLSKQWQIIGHRGTESPSIQQNIASLTGIPPQVLQDPDELLSISAEVKITWASRRETTREEDRWYCLFGMLDAPIGANYGEGVKRARRRLLAELIEVGSITKARAIAIAESADRVRDAPREESSKSRNKRRSAGDDEERALDMSQPRVRRDEQLPRDHELVSRLYQQFSRRGCSEDEARSLAIKFYKRTYAEKPPPLVKQSSEAPLDRALLSRIHQNLVERGHSDEDAKRLALEVARNATSTHLRLTSPSQSTGDQEAVESDEESAAEDSANSTPPRSP